MRKLLTIIYLFGLMLYILAGVPLTPFHGDESTLIYTTRDYFDQFVAHDLEQVTSTAPDTNPMDVNLRLLDGRVQKYVGGFAYHLTGGTADGLNQPWEWGGDYRYNQDNGNLPAPDVLMINRLAMAILLALCIPTAFGIGMSIGGWPAALIVPTLLAMSPNLVLNGRRAMMEAPLMLFSLLMVLSALRWAAPHSRRGGWLMSLALSAGLALSSKHSGVLAIVPAFGALGVLTLWRRDWRGLMGLFAAGVAALGVFYVFNPAWWPSPINAAQTVLQLRSELLAGQTQFFGGYAGFGEQLAGFWRQTFVGTPQFYEVDSWASFIGSQISAYQASPWGGVILGTAGGAILALLTVLGGIALSRRRDAAAWVFGGYAIGVITAALLLTPLEWARYYLVGLPGVYGLAAIGVSTLITRIRRPATS